jgi:hypothetical protein
MAFREITVACSENQLKLTILLSAQNVEFFNIRLRGIYLRLPLQVKALRLIKYSFY